MSKRDREQIIEVANQIAADDMTWLCPTFAHSDWPKHLSAYEVVPRYLRSLGGKPVDSEGSFFWPSSYYDDDARNQRLTFLAFMLAWEENP